MLDLPVLLIHGRQDRVVPAVHCAEVADAFGNAAVRWTDECGHFPQIEHADAVNGWLAEFLVGRPAPR
jgi:pimeloyl-ACP methyl ester carboxylesterase